MRTPISACAAWPGRIASRRRGAGHLRCRAVDFTAPDLARFPSLRLAYQAWRAGGTAPTLLNAANECAVQAFLERRIPFTAIPTVIEQVLTELTPRAPVHWRRSSKTISLRVLSAQRVIEHEANRARTPDAQYSHFHHLLSDCARSADHGQRVRPFLGGRRVGVKVSALSRSASVRRCGGAPAPTGTEYVLE